MATVALQMIVKDEYDSVAKILWDAIDYFDEINLVVSDKPTANKLSKWQADKASKIPCKVNVKWREWTDDFAAARNANFELCTADYAFWLDADDEFDFKLIPGIMEVAVAEDIDAIWMPYNYAQDENGVCITRHWRERMVKMSLPWEWRGRVHETCILDTDHKSHKINNEIVHRSDHGEQSHIRNHKILEKAVAETDDPRYKHYLGMSYFAMGNYVRCADVLSEYLKDNGSVEDSYRSLCVISEAGYHMGQHAQALEFAVKATVLKPEYPMAFWLLAQYEADQKNWSQAIEWVRVAESKPDPQTLSVWDPSSRGRAALIAAQAEFMLCNFNAALAWLKKSGKNKDADMLWNDFVSEADAETFVNWLPEVVKYFESKESLYKALCTAMKYDTRLSGLRQAATKPRTWGDKEITLFCGQGFEEWGPDTLDQGMGGSEEAVVYLSRELAKLGYQITVYCDRATEYEDFIPENIASVKYKPWRMIDTRDDFNIFIAWRMPPYFENIHAKVKICDVHDALPEKLMLDNKDDVTFMVKSQYHRSLSPNIADEQIEVVGNGIVKEQFND